MTLETDSERVRMAEKLAEVHTGGSPSTTADEELRRIEAERAVNAHQGGSPGETVDASASTEG